jgi:dihydroorotate dehydrogenase electron transfer subunit
MANEELTGSVYRLTLSAGEIAAEAKPGQFVYVRCAGLDAYMRRPFGIAAVNAADGALILYYEVKGYGTALLARYSAGSRLDVMGPLGNGFDVGILDGGSERGARASAATARGGKEGAATAGGGIERVAIVGGGAGVFPLLFLAKTLNGMRGVSADAYLGFADGGSVVLADEFGSLASRTVIATDDGSAGVRGFVTEPFRDSLSNCRYDMAYACGPEPMLRTVQRICAEFSLPAQISVEQRMGCGIGACLGCACKVKAGGRGNISGAGPYEDSGALGVYAGGCDASGEYCEGAADGVAAATRADAAPAAETQADAAPAAATRADAAPTAATRAGAEDFRYARVCKDGPVFWASEVIFDG